MHHFWKRTLYRSRWAILYALFLGIAFPTLIYLNYTKFQNASENAFRSFEGKNLAPEDWSKLREISNAITYLNFKDSTFSDNNIPQLRELPKLRTVDLSGTAITSAGLEELSKSKSIQTLYLKKLQTPAEDFERIFGALSKFQELESIDLSENRLGAVKLASVSLPKRLQFLSLRENQLRDEIFQVLGKKYIRSIDLSGNLLEGVGSASLKSAYFLDLSNNKLGRTGMQELGGVAIENLDLSQMQLGDEDLAGLTGSKSLKRLVLSKTSITPKSLSLFTTLKNLRSLDLSYTSALDETAEGLNQLQLISELELEGLRISGKAAAQLANLRALTSMNLSSCSFLDAFEEAGFPRHLQSIRLSKTIITRRTIDKLLELKGLLEIDLSETNVGDDEVEKVLTLPELEELYLPGTQITDKALTAFHSSLNLYTVDVSRTAVTKAAIDAARRVNDSIYFVTEDD